MLSPQSLTRYQEIYKKLYGVELDPVVAEVQGTKLVSLVRVVLEHQSSQDNRQTVHIDNLQTGT